jgi:competence protein ComEA
VRILALAAGTAALLGVATPALAAKRPLGAGERIDLNHASIAELMRLPAVGQKRAQAIVAQRARKPFGRIDDVVAVKGIGKAWVARVKGNVSVGGGPAPMAPAHAVASK